MTWVCPVVVPLVCCIGCTTTFCGSPTILLGVKDETGCIWTVVTPSELPAGLTILAVTEDWPAATEATLSEGTGTWDREMTGVVLDVVLVPLIVGGPVAVTVCIWLVAATVVPETKKEKLMMIWAHLFKTNDVIS